ncbi:MAG: type I phosphomannose isomerase catalytic subunit [Clostridia bacterium]
MIRKSMISNINPFLLKACGKDYIWGGDRLNEDFGKNIDLSPLAETWECSTHPDGESLVASGKFKGETLTHVIKMHPEILGTHPKTKGELPILIKFIDAKKDLSVQVHPNDEYAYKMENKSLGKTEMWYVLDAKINAKIIYGFIQTMDKDLLRESIKNGSVEKYLQKVTVKKDDVFYIEAGKVHAIGAGTLIAEIQENSNLTYRMYDYNRIGNDGKLRELHIEKAIDVACLKGQDRVNQPMRVLQYTKSSASEILCKCEYFQVERLLINTERNNNLYEFSTDSTTFQVLLCLNGCGTMIDDIEDTIMFGKGDCIFIPANSNKIKIHATARLLRVKC